MSSSPVFVGVDVGGTFTDIVTVGRNGESTAFKVLTTYPDPSQGVLEGLREGLARRGVPIRDVGVVVHGTTWATNAIIERKGAKTALFTTKGFRDILETGTEIRYDLYDLFLEKPEPLVARRLRIGIDERMDYEGEQVTPLDASQVSEETRRLTSESVESLAICFLHSYANSTHEDEACRIIKAEAPGLHVSLSSSILPEMGEFVRLSTTVANAYVRPKMKTYLDKLVEALTKDGLTGLFYVMASNGGSMSVRDAAEYPVKVIESGPAAGAAASSHLARILRARKVMALDVGGTTAKMCLILDGKALRANELEVARLSRFKKGSGLVLRTPSVDLIEVGTGGGSIAFVDGQGLLKVGPESSAANPGPACYGLGGTRPTLTDADLVLGYLNPDYFLGGAMHLDLDAAVRAIGEHVAEPLGRQVLEAANGMFNLANDNMASAASVYAADRGVDIRGFAALTFGGAGPVHAWAIAEKLGIRRIIVPLGAGVFSALGCVVAPVSFDFSTTYRAELDALDLERLNKLIRNLESRAIETLAPATGNGKIRLDRSVDMRYLNQRHEVSIPFGEGEITANHIHSIMGAFHEIYVSRYGSAILDMEVETVNWRVHASVDIQKKKIRWKSGTSDVRDPVKGTRNIFFGEMTECEVYDRYGLKPGAVVNGPCIIEERESTTSVPPGTKAEVDDMLNLILTKAR